MGIKLPSDQWPLWLTIAAITAYVFSIAAGNILIALALASLLFSREKLRFPPFWVPLVLFCAGTVVSMVLSSNPAAGRPQIRKFILYFVVPLIVYSVITNLERLRIFLAALLSGMTISALWSFVQFARKVHAAASAPVGFYQFYNGDRITGFMSHWMTLGGQEMTILLMAIALFFWTNDRRWRPWLAASIAIISISLILGFTRSIWLGALCGSLYLIWHWRRIWLLAVPLPIILLMLINPFAIRDRAISAFIPHGDTDSNEFRSVTRRAGWEMIKAHPWFGLGPEMIKESFNKGEFKNWVPADVHRPLPTGWYGHLHNIYIHFAAERGVPTMLALMWFFGLVLYHFIRGTQTVTEKAARGILLGGVAVILAMLIVGYYEVNFGDSEVLVVFLGTISALYCLLPYPEQIKAAV